MKHMAFSIVGAVIIFVVAAILFSLHARNIRKVELERSLSAAVRQSLNKACVTDTDEIGDNDALIADFISNFLGRMKSDGKDIDIEIRSADIYKGILSAHVTEKYTFPNGRKGKVEASAASVVERESRRPTVSVNYYISWERARDAGFDYEEGKDFLLYTRRASKGYEKAVPVKAPDTGDNKSYTWMPFTDANGEESYMAVYE